MSYIHTSYVIIVYGEAKGHVTLSPMLAMRTAYKNDVANPQGKRSLRKPRRRWAIILKRILNK